MPPETGVCTHAGSTCMPAGTKVGTAHHGSMTVRHFDYFQCLQRSAGRRRGPQLLSSRLASQVITMVLNGVAPYQDRKDACTAAVCSDAPACTVSRLSDARRQPRAAHRTTRCGATPLHGRGSCYFERACVTGTQQQKFALAVLARCCKVHWPSDCYPRGSFCRIMWRPRIVTRAFAARLVQPYIPQLHACTSPHSPLPHNFEPLIQRTHNARTPYRKQSTCLTISSSQSGSPLATRCRRHRPLSSCL